MVIECVNKDGGFFIDQGRLANDIIFMESSWSGLKRIYIEFEDNNECVPVLVHAFEHIKEGLYHDL